jgi:DNA-binding transcriptional ArsR family regulator
MPDRPAVVHDPSVLRAIAHPVRNRILSELAAQGPLRAADLAGELDIPANQASFHLRQLARYGLVEDDPGAARDRRDRVWKLTSPQGLHVDLVELERSPQGRAAATVFRRNAAQWGHVVVEQAYSPEREAGTHRSLTEIALRLTEEEARQVAQELNDVLDSWRRRTLGRDPSRRTYLYFGVLQAHPGNVQPDPDPDAAPAPDPDPDADAEPEPGPGSDPV